MTEDEGRKDVTEGAFRESLSFRIVLRYTETLIRNREKPLGAMSGPEVIANKAPGNSVLL